MAGYNDTPYGTLSLHTGSVTTPFQYAGQYTDAETGFQYLQARYYDPATAQFLSPDPLAAQTRQPYSYAADDPLNGSDPSGLCDVVLPFVGRQHVPGTSDSPILCTDAAKLKAHDALLATSSGLSSFTNSSFANHAIAPVTTAWDTVSSLAQYYQRLPQDLHCGLGAVALDTARTWGPLAQAAYYLTPMGAPAGAQAQGQAWAQDLGNGDYGAIAGDALAYAGMAGAGRVLGALGEVGAADAGLAEEGSVAANRPLGRGSTGRTVPTNLREQLAMQEAMADPAAGTRINLRNGMTDPRWPASDGWVKMVQHISGVEIHYVRNAITGAVDDYKFKD